MFFNINREDIYIKNYEKSNGFVRVCISDKSNNQDYCFNLVINKNINRIKKVLKELIIRIIINKCYYEKNKSETGLRFNIYEYFINNRLKPPWSE